MNRLFCPFFHKHRNSRIKWFLISIAVLSFFIIVSRQVPVIIGKQLNSTVQVWFAQHHNHTYNATSASVAGDKKLHCQWIGPSIPNVSATAHGIPFILHQIYSSEFVPEQYAKLIHGCRTRNPNFIHFLWTDSDANVFVNTFYPKMRSLFRQYQSGVQKSDFFRILLLYHFGGVYLDMDVECIQPLQFSLDRFNSSCILDRERELQTRLRWNRDFTAMNSAMMSRPGHPFFKFLLSKLPEHLHQNNVMWRTGPFFLDDRLKEYKKLAVARTAGVTLAPSSAFSPILDQGLFKMFRTRCRGITQVSRGDTIRRRGCQEWNHFSLKAEKIAERKAIVVHRFLHLAYKGYRKAIKRKTGLCSFVPNLKRYRSVMVKKT